MAGLFACRPKYRTWTLCPGLVGWRVSCAHDVAHSASGLVGGYLGPVCGGEGPQVETAPHCADGHGAGYRAERSPRAVAREQPLPVPADVLSPSLPSLLVATRSGARTYAGVV